jgi:hypothetical protein
VIPWTGAAPEALHVTVSCVLRTRSRNRNANVCERILWQEARVLTGSEAPLYGDQLRAPVDIALPADAPQTSAEQAGSETLWRLEAYAEIPGVDLKAQFVLPVFAPDAAHGLAPVPLMLKRSDGPSAAPRAASSVRVTPVPGGAEYFFPAGRNKGAAAALWSFWLLWTGALVFWIWVARQAGPILYLIIPLLALFDLLFLILGMVMLFGSETLTVAGGRLRVRGNGFALKTPRDLSVGDIRDVALKINTQVGQTVYYDLQLIPKLGRPFTVGCMLQDKREAEMLAAQIRKTLNPGPSAGDAPN